MFTLIIMATFAARGVKNRPRMADFLRVAVRFFGFGGKAESLKQARSACQCATVASMSTERFISAIIKVHIILFLASHVGPRRL